VAIGGHLPFFALRFFVTLEHAERASIIPVSAIPPLVTLSLSKGASEHAFSQSQGAGPVF